MAVVLLTAVLALHPVAAADASQELRAYVSPYVTMGDFSGVISVAPAREVPSSTAFGATAVSDTFMIGSVSKTFTAAAIELLVRDGRVRYSDLLGKYVPEYRYGNRITIEQLLAHTAGVPDFYSLQSFGRMRTQNLSLTAIAKWLSAYPLDFPPGSKSVYSNSGYSLLALVIERVSHQPYSQFLEAAIFRPIGLHDTGDLESGAPKDLAIGYDPAMGARGLGHAQTIAAGWLVGDGSIYSSAADMSAWLDVANAGTLVNFNGLPYPYGWGVEKRGASTLLTQDGRIPGYATSISIDRKTGLKIIVMSNIQCAAVTKIAQDVRTIAEGGTVANPALRASYDAGASVLRSVAGSYSFGPTLRVVVRVEHGQAFLANATDGMWYPLEPTSKDTFFFRPLYASVTFERDSAQRVTSLQWNGQFSAPKVQDDPGG